MIKSSLLFGQYVQGSLLEKVSMRIISMMKEESYHHMDKILSLGEISDKLYFVTKGKVAVTVNSACQDFYRDFVDEKESTKRSLKS